MDQVEEVEEVVNKIVLMGNNTATEEAQMQIIQPHSGRRLSFAEVRVLLNAYLTLRNRAP